MSLENAYNIEVEMKLISHYFDNGLLFFSFFLKNKSVFPASKMVPLLVFLYDIHLNIRLWNIGWTKHPIGICQLGCYVYFPTFYEPNE